MKCEAITISMRFCWRCIHLHAKALTTITSRSGATAGVAPRYIGVLGQDDNQQQSWQKKSGRTFASRENGGF